MKILIKFIFALLILIYTSCLNYDDTGTVEMISKLDKSEAESIVNKLRQDLSFSVLSDAFTGNEKVLESSIIEIENTYYLRTIFDNEYVSTTLLVVDSISNRMISGRITCTSKSCATSNGCIPHSSGTKCTSCFAGLGDCTKTVSSLQDNQ